MVCKSSRVELAIRLATRPASLLYLEKPNVDAW